MTPDHWTPKCPSFSFASFLEAKNIRHAKGSGKIGDNLGGLAKLLQDPLVPLVTDNGPPKYREVVGT